MLISIDESTVCHFILFFFSPGHHQIQNPGHLYHIEDQVEVVHHLQGDGKGQGQKIPGQEVQHHLHCEFSETLDALYVRLATSITILSLLF